MAKLNITPANSRDENGRERFFQFDLQDHMFTEDRKNVDGSNAMVLLKFTKPLKTVNIP